MLGMTDADGGVVVADEGIVAVVTEEGGTVAVSSGATAEAE